MGDRVRATTSFVITSFHFFTVLRCSPWRPQLSETLDFYCSLVLCCHAWQSSQVSAPTVPRLSDMTLKTAAIPKTGRITLWDHDSPLGVPLHRTARRYTGLCSSAEKKYTCRRAGLALAIHHSRDNDGPLPVMPAKTIEAECPCVWGVSCSFDNKDRQPDVHSWATAW
jgi:hypothetical protein